MLLFPQDGDGRPRRMSLAHARSGSVLNDVMSESEEEEMRARVQCTVMKMIVSHRCVGHREVGKDHVGRA